MELSDLPVELGVKIAEWLEYPDLDKCWELSKSWKSAGEEVFQKKWSYLTFLQRPLQFESFAGWFLFGSTFRDYLSESFAEDVAGRIHYFKLVHQLDYRQLGLILYSSLSWLESTSPNVIVENHYFRDIVDSLMKREEIANKLLDVAWICVPSSQRFVFTPYCVSLLGNVLSDLRIREQDWWLEPDPQTIMGQVLAIWFAGQFPYSNHTGLYPPSTSSFTFPSVIPSHTAATIKHVVQLFQSRRFGPASKQQMLRVCQVKIEEILGFSINDF